MLAPLSTLFFKSWQIFLKKLVASSAEHVRLNLSPQVIPPLIAACMLVVAEVEKGVLAADPKKVRTDEQPPESGSFGVYCETRMI